MEPTSTTRYEPLDTWMASTGVAAADLLRAERAGLPLPVWMPPDGRVLVDLLRVHSWRELAAITGIFAPKARAA